jgi:(p)ppGpp synthase/HD superfamily hydrolase
MVKYHHLTRKELQELKGVTHREYLYGDFDKDKVRNVDDPRPFDKKVSKWPHHRGYYAHKARYGNTEVKLSNELRAIELYNNKQYKRMAVFLKHHPGAIGRVKTVPSTLKKMREDYLEQGGIRDVVATSIITSNRAEAYEQEKRLQSQHKTLTDYHDDYYAKPKGGVHYALHNTVAWHNAKHPMEVQIASKAMHELDEKAHPYYKRGIVLPEHRREGKRKYKAGL